MTVLESIATQLGAGRSAYQTLSQHGNEIALVIYPAHKHMERTDRIESWLSQATDVCLSVCVLLIANNRAKRLSLTPTCALRVPWVCVYGKRKKTTD